MAGKKNRSEAKGQSRRGAGSSLQSSGSDEVTRRLPPMRAQDDLVFQQDVPDLPAPAPGEAIQEENLKAALDSPNIYVETTDNDGNPSVVEIEREVALLSPYMQREVLQQGNGVSNDKPIILPNKVTLEILELLLTYCRFHRASGRSDKERKIFDEKFIRLDTRRLCELTSAADALAMKPLVDLTSRALARLIEGKTPEQIRAQFQLPDDLTEEEKLEPVRNFGDDPKIRLLNRLYEKKRKELQKRRDEEQKLISDGSVPVLTYEEKRQQDERSVDELLSFIENGGGSTSATPRGKKKKGKQSRKLSPSEDAQHNSSTPVPSMQQSGSVRGRQSAPQPSPLDSSASPDPLRVPSAPLARKLDSTKGGRIPSAESKRRPDAESAMPSSTVSHPSSVSTLEDRSSLEQNGLSHTQQASEAQDKARQARQHNLDGPVNWHLSGHTQQPLDAPSNAELPKQKSLNGSANRHLNEEDNAEDDKHETDGSASEASDMEDIDEEEDEEEDSPENSYQMHRKELLSGSFGPLQGPITTLTSLAAFKARFQQPAIPSSMPSMPSAAQQPSQDASFGSLPPQQPSKVASDSQDHRPAQHSLAGLASEEPSSAVMSSGEEHNTSNISQHSHAVAAALTDRLGGEAHHVAKHSEAGHDRQHATSPSISNEGASAIGPPSSQPAQSEVHMLWEDPANITAAREALVTFLQKSGLLKHLQIDSVAPHSIGEEHSGALEQPNSQNGHVEPKTEHTVSLSKGYVLQLKIAQIFNAVSES